MARKLVKSDHVRVRVLGKAEIHVGTRKIGMNTEAMFALALYLTTRAGDRIPRDELLEMFWPEGSDESRRHAMRQMLYRLRQKGMVFDEEGEFLRLDPSRIDSDLRACLAAEWPESAPAADVEASLALGPTFSNRLPGAVLAWFDGVRGEVEVQQRRAAQRQVVQARREGRWADLDRWARVILKTDALNEEATLARAEAAAMEGSKVAAIGILDNYLSEVQLIAPALLGPAQALKRRISERRADWHPRGPKEVELIGRESVLARLTASLDSAANAISVSACISGGSGLGKSRLLRELCELAALRGLRVCHIRVQPSWDSAPLALARELAVVLLEQPSAAGIDPSAMRTLTALAGQRERPISASLTLTSASQTPLLRDAFVDLFGAIGERTKLLVAIDDVQYADDISLSLVSLALRCSRDSRVCTVLATHTHGLERLGLTQPIPGIDVIRLPPLDTTSSREIAVKTLSLHRTSLSPRQLDDVVASAGGNPLFVRELAVAHATGGALKTGSSSLLGAIAKRMGALTSVSIRLLRLVVLLGDTATVCRLRGLSYLSSRQLQEELDNLAGDGVVQLSSARTVQLHDIWREAVLSQLSDVAEASLALECADYLDIDPERESAHVRRRIGQLLVSAGQPARALGYTLEGAEALLDAGLPDECLTTLESFPTAALDSVSSARVVIRRALALLTKGEPAAAELQIRRVWQSRILQGRMLSEHLLAVGVAAECAVKLDQADQGPIVELLELSRNESLGSVERRRACLWGMRLATNAAQRGFLAKFVESLRAAPTETTLTPETALTELIFAAETGSVPEIVSAHEVLSSVPVASLPVHEQCLLLRFSCHALRIARDVRRAKDAGEAAYHLAMAHSLHHQARIAAELLCYLNLDEECVDEAEAWNQRSAELTASAPHGTSRISLDHARDRIDIQRGRFREVAERALGRLGDVRNIRTKHARYGVIALMAYALAEAGQHEAARELIVEANDGIAQFAGSPGGDFPTEMLLRAHQSVSPAEPPPTGALTHLVQRCSTGRPPLAPLFATLRSSAETI